VITGIISPIKPIPPNPRINNIHYTM